MLLVLLFAAPAQASEANTILERCNEGKSLSGFSQNGYREALKQMPTGAIEYSDCPNLIRKAELAAAGGGAPGESSSSSATPIPLTPAERQEVQRAHRHGAAPISIGGRAVRPGVVSADIGSVTSTLPSSLQGLLALLVASGVAVAARKGYRRVRAGRSR